MNATQDNSGESGTEGNDESGMDSESEETICSQGAIDELQKVIRELREKEEERMEEKRNAMETENQAAQGWARERKIARLEKEVIRKEGYTGSRAVAVRNVQSGLRDEKEKREEVLERCWK